MTKSNCIITCEFDMTEYARLFTYEALTEDTCAVTGYVGSAPSLSPIPWRPSAAAPSPSA